MPAVGWREARNEDKEPSPVLAAMATVDKDVPAGASNRTVRPRAIVADSVQPAKHYSRRSLRRAVIWSEILGPSVSPPLPPDQDLFVFLDKKITNR
jgi:hypothetical protein